MSLATSAALALLGLVLAYWTWAWFAPQAEPRAQDAVPAAQTGARAEAASGLFNGPRRDGKGTAPAGIAIGLLGVVAADSRRPGTSPGYAVLRLDAKQSVAVREGGEIEPGLRLAEVHADHVVLERSGIRETLAWPEQGKAATPVVPPTGKQ